MNLFPNLLFVLVWLLYVTTPGSGHEICIGGPPNRQALSMCTDMQEASCCTEKREKELIAEFNHIFSQLPPEYNENHCKEILSRVMCQTCSKYFEHQFDFADNDLHGMSMPGLCPTYCLHVYSSCPEILPLLIKNAKLQGVLDKGATAFCEAITLADPYYCYSPSTFPQKNNIFHVASTNAKTKMHCFCLLQFTHEIKSPKIFRPISDGSGRILIGEHAGKIHMFNKEGVKLSKESPFLDISKRVFCNTNYKSEERGLNSFALHPDFSSNGKMYVLYSQICGSWKITCATVSEFIANKDRTHVDDDKGRTVFEVKHPGPYHGADDILFGPDGYLYIVLGDGGPQKDPANRAQDMQLFWGKCLRIDVDVPEGHSASYLIPADNPYVGSNDAKPEIWAQGFRNPWRFSFDRGDKITGKGRGRLFVGDVGQSTAEEINIIKRGRNYGWSKKEGDKEYKGGPVLNEELPIIAMDHNEAQAVIGGYVYRGSQMPSLYGQYIFAEYQKRKIIKLVEINDGQWIKHHIQICNTDICGPGYPHRAVYPHLAVHIHSVGEDEDGEIYFLAEPNFVFKMWDPFGKK